MFLEIVQSEDAHFQYRKTAAVKAQLGELLRAPVARHVHELAASAVFDQFPLMQLREVFFRPAELKWNGKHERAAGLEHRVEPVESALHRRRDVLRYFAANDDITSVLHLRRWFRNIETRRP